MKRLGKAFWEMGEDVDYLHCSSDPDSLDGVIFCGRKMAVVDGTAPHVIEPTAPGAKEEYINLGVLWDREALIPYREKILQGKTQIHDCYQKVYQALGQAKEVHDRWEKVYGENTDYGLLNQLTEEFLDQVLGKIPAKAVSGQEVHRFFGALTPAGSVNYVESLLAPIKTRCFIKGRPGTGKSTLLKKLAHRAVEKGLKAEIYHCSFDPMSLDMVVLPELSFGAFDATDPHEFFPDRNTDWVLDLYEGAVRPGTDEENYELLSLFQREYGEKITLARESLGRAREIHGQLETIYGKAMNFSPMAEIISELRSYIQ